MSHPPVQWVAGIGSHGVDLVVVMFLTALEMNSRQLDWREDVVHSAIGLCLCSREHDPALPLVRA